MDAQTALPNPGVTSDLLVGARAIGEFLNRSPRQVFHLQKIHALPIFKLGSNLAARKAELLERLTASAA